MGTIRYNTTMYDPNQITYFGETDARNRRVPFGIRAKDRTRHVYVIGKTGMGKSTILENMAVQDIRNGNGFAFMDPHGKTADLFLEYIPEERINDVLYFAPFDMDFPISFNIMEDVGYDKRHLVVSGLMGAFKKIWQDAWSARMEYILSNTLLALLEYPDATLLSVNKMLSDKAYRKKVVDNVQDTAVKSFWVDEFANYTERMAAEAVPAIQNKVGQFTSNPLIRNIIGQPKSSFDLRQIMDSGKIMLINLSKGRIGEANANLLGSLLITKIYLSAMSRADVPEAVLEKELPNFYLYVDEFQSFANESFADILSEARKYKLNLTIAHQYIEQMSEEVRAAVFGNVGTMITFRVGSYDAEVLEKEFAPEFTAQDIVNLGRFQIYLRLMIDSVGSKPFSASTLPPLEKLEHNFVPQIIETSRKTYGRPRAEVEEEVKRLVEMGRQERDQNQGGGKKGGNQQKGPRSDGQRNDGQRNDHQRSGKDFNKDSRNRGGDVRGDGQKSNKKGGGGPSQKEEMRPVIDEKTKNELQALLAKHTDATPKVEETEPEVQPKKIQQEVDQLLQEEIQEVQVPPQQQVQVQAQPQAQPKVEANVNPKPKPQQTMKELNKKMQAIIDSDKDLEDDLRPMRSAPAQRNDPKQVTPENKNQLADALKAALGQAAPAKPAAQEQSSQNQSKPAATFVNNKPPVSASTPPQLQRQEPQKQNTEAPTMQSMQSAINSILQNTSAPTSSETSGQQATDVIEPEKASQTVPQQPQQASQSPRPASGGSTVNEVSEAELRSILGE